MQTVYIRLAPRLNPDGARGQQREKGKSKPQTARSSNQTVYSAKTNKTLQAKAKHIPNIIGRNSFPPNPHTTAHSDSPRRNPKKVICPATALPADMSCFACTARLRKKKTSLSQNGTAQAYRIEQPQVLIHGNVNLSAL